MIDKLIAAKITDNSEANTPRYSAEVELALYAAGEFTRQGGNVCLVKGAHQVWQMTAWQGKGRQHTESGPFASALCRAMLAAVGVSVKSSDG